jgi:DNA uptake protein ComE-like DNA-binding protein
VSLTASERTAMKWLILVISVGTASKVARQWRYNGDSNPASTEALNRQLLAVDSAQRSGAGGRRRSARKGGARGQADSAGGSVGRRVRGSSQTPPAEQVSSSSARGSVTEAPILEPIDLDRADSAALERLPRIGPALASRIVADRAERGPFGSLEGFERVRGIGPKLANLLRSRVTFSGIPRPTTVRR